jgi:small subunit ribosomal protein S8
MSCVIADLFTRIRNAAAAEHQDIEVRFSNLKLEIVKILKEEGFVRFYEVVRPNDVKRGIKVGLKYGPSGESVVSSIVAVSRPGKRVYVKKAQIPKVRNGFGICILSTPKGVLSGRASRLANVGGELLAIVY